MPSRRHFLTGVGGAIAAGLSGCSGSNVESSSDWSPDPGTEKDTDWSMPRFDTLNTAYNPDAKAPREGVRERWTFGDGSTLSAGTPAIVDGRVFFPTGQSLVALDASSGDVLWKHTLDHGDFSDPVVHDGFVYINALGDLHALDVKTGEKAWSLTDAGYIDGSPHLVAGDQFPHPKLYAGTGNGKILRLELKTGEILRKTDVFGGITTMAYWPSVLYVGTTGGEVYSFLERDVDRPLGERWRRKVGAKIEGMVPTSEELLVDTFGGPLRCLQTGPHAGTTRWKVPAKQANSAPVYGDNTVFAAGSDSLTAHRDYDTKTRWKHEGRFDRAAPGGAGDRLYVSDGDTVHGFALGGDGSGSEADRWSHPTPSATGLSVAEGALFVACEGSMDGDASLYCLESA